MRYHSVVAGKFYYLFLLAGLFVTSFRGESQRVDTPAHSTSDTTILRMADPTIFLYKDTYYLYGTGGDVNKGFLVYTSTDMKTWKGPAGLNEGYALVKGDTYGTQGFWAPQVFLYNRKFYMAYTANEHIAIAESNSPLGPFRQQEIRPVSGEGKQIDPFIFFDDNGKKYLYHVRLSEGNRLFVGEMNDELTDIKAGTVQLCIAAKDQPWENTANTNWPVSEGPTVLKHKGLYYLFYSANDFRNIDYAVGFATASTPFGPWLKNQDNPVLSRQNIGVNGTGHGDIVKDKEGNLNYVFHTHASGNKVQPRLTAVVGTRFVTDRTGVVKFSIDRKSFRYLYLSK